MNTEALILIIRAIRKTYRAAEALSILTEGHSFTLVDEAHGDLIDAVLMLCGEQVDELPDSLTYRLIMSDQSDEQVANILAAVMQNETASKAS